MSTFIGSFPKTQREKGKLGKKGKKKKKGERGTHSQKPFSV